MVFTFNLKVKVAEQEVFEALDQVVLCAAGFGIDDEQQNLLRLSLEELLLNVCHHSGLPSNAVVDVALVLRDGVLRLTITDSGPSFDPLALAAPDLDLPIEQRQIGGLGIHFVRSTSARCAWQRLDGCNVVEVDWIIAC
ncbi:MAG: ATP-binding protein [Planctomycetota bacterium]|nr:ATP-binding protein [Planctomycetota bacterium]MSR38281.1 ATP-binding protein [Planctomycetota bacterium]